MSKIENFFLGAILCATCSHAAEIEFQFEFELFEAAAPLSIGDIVSGSLTYEDSTPISNVTFENAITSITINASGQSHTFSGDSFDFNSAGPDASFFVATFDPQTSGALPFELANFGMGFPSDASPPGYVPDDLTTYANLFPNNFLYQMTYDNFAFAQGRGDAALVPEPSMAFLLLSGFALTLLRYRK